MLGFLDALRAEGRWVRVSSGIAVVKVSGKCPHCDVRKNQIDTSEEHAVQVLDDAFARHIAEVHPDVEQAQP